MNASRWTKDGIIHGFDEKNRRVTAKYSTDGEDVLIARGHVQDIQQEVDHVHAWNQKTGEPGHHDMRHSRKMFPQVKDNWVVASEAKEKLISRAEQLATTTDWKKGGEEFKSLLTEWKAVGRGEKSADAAQWERFKAAREKFNSARSAYFEKRQREWASNKAAKERIVSQAESLAGSSDLRSASEQMRRLGEEWKQVGPCEKGDNDRLWARFNQARTRLRDRKQQDFEKRQREWASNKAAKERLIYQMSLLVNSNDYRAAKDQARQLDTQWRAIGPCAKEDRDRLWQQYKSAKDQLFEAAKRAGEQRKAEARQRAQERVWRLEEQLRNVENALQRAEENYSRALSARSPSMRNPHWREISQKQLDRQSAARQKVQSIQQRRSEVIQKLGDARSRLNQF
jgi:putative ATPase involved in DNA repair